MESSHGPREAVRVLICGASYGGLAAATNLIELCAGRPHKLPDFSEGLSGYEVPVELTLVDERDGFFHLIGSPLALAEAEYAHRAWQKFEDIAVLQQPNIRFVHGTVANIDLEAKNATIQHNGEQDVVTESYDYMIAATGLRRVWPTVPQALSKQKYLMEAQGHIDQVQGAESGIVVIGGGAVGIEMAAELKLVVPNIPVTLVHSRDKLMSSEPVPGHFRDQVADLLRDTGVEVITGKRVIESLPCTKPGSLNTTTLKLSDGSEIHAGHVISAISKPTSTASYLPQQTLTSEGLVRITDNLTFDSTTPNAECHYAVGDIIARPGIKRCGAAMYTGNIAAFNIYQHLLHARGYSAEKPPVYQTFPDSSPSIVLAVGKQAIGYSADHWQETGGVMKGTELMQMFFEDDLGLGICWRHLGLGDKAPSAEVGEAA